MNFESHDDTVWIAWAAFGTFVCWRVLHESLKDYHFVQAEGINGSNLRDAWEAVVQNGIRVAIQVMFVVTGVWRTELQPGDRWWWDIPDKMFVSTIAIICASTLLAIAALRDLRNRRLQMLEHSRRRAGKKFTRVSDLKEAPNE